MKISKHFFKYVLFISALCCIILVCHKKESDNLQNWVGKYSFEECSVESEDTPMVMDYKIEIYKEKNEYFAHIEKVGQTTWINLKAKVYGNQEWISLVFEEALPENVTYNSDSKYVLLSLRKEESVIYTYWGKIEPMLYDNEQSEKETF